MCHNAQCLGKICRSLVSIRQNTLTHVDNHMGTMVFEEGASKNTILAPEIDGLQKWPLSLRPRSPLFSDAPECHCVAWYPTIFMPSPPLLMLRGIYNRRCCAPLPMVMHAPGSSSNSYLICMPEASEMTKVLIKVDSQHAPPQAYMNS